MSELKQKLKEQIIEQLNLVEVKPSDIQDNQPLFGSELGLDSIDALEFIVLLDSKYGLKIDDPAKGKEIFNSINSLAAFIEANQK
ncbi:MAG: acyl carrier protein [Flavobacteriia bacterium]|nr:acyl carrier protein [Flavobacteriia bacterium]